MQESLFVLFVWFNSLHPSQHFSVMSERVSLGRNRTKQQIKCLAKGHNTVTLLAVSLQLATLQFSRLTLYQAAAFPMIHNITLSIPMEPKHSIIKGMYCMCRYPTFEKNCEYCQVQILMLVHVEHNHLK